MKNRIVVAAFACCSITSFAAEQALSADRSIEVAVPAGIRWGFVCDLLSLAGGEGLTVYVVNGVTIRYSGTILDIRTGDEAVTLGGDDKHIDKSVAEFIGGSRGRQCIINAAEEVAASRVLTIINALNRAKAEYTLHGPAEGAKASEIVLSFIPEASSRLWKNGESRK